MVNTSDNNHSFFVHIKQYKFFLYKFDIAYNGTDSKIIQTAEICSSVTYTCTGE